MEPLVWPSSAKWQIFVTTLFLAAAVAITAWLAASDMQRVMGALSFMYVLLWWLSTLVRVLHERAEVHSSYVLLCMVSTLLKKSEQRIDYGSISDVLIGHGFEGEKDLIIFLRDGSKVHVCGLCNPSGLRDELVSRITAHREALMD